MSSSQDFEHKIDFSGLVLGFSSAALYYLGEGPEKAPDSQKNFDLARQNIDIIELLAEKTKNNLSAEEKQLLDHILTDLRLKFVESSKK